MPASPRGGWLSSRAVAVGMLLVDAVLIYYIFVLSFSSGRCGSSATSADASETAGRASHRSSRRMAPYASDALFDVSARVTADTESSFDSCSRERLTARSKSRQDYKQASLSEADYNAVIEHNTSRGGVQTKAGIVPLHLWDPHSEPAMRERFEEWLGNASFVAGVQTAPPQVAPCTVLVNHQYKVIFVKNTKVAGTSVFLYFGGGYCKGTVPGYPIVSSEGYRRNPDACFTRLSSMDPATPDPQAQWQDYFVFTIARNPFSRAASSFDYITSLRKGAKGAQCAAPPFSRFCRSPYAFGIQDRLFGCHNAVHDFYHVEPQAHCLTTEEGELAVDFVVRYESLEEDFHRMVAVINEQLPEGTPALTGSLSWSQRGPAASTLSDVHDDMGEASQPTSRHVTKFEACGQSCLRHIETYYESDFSLLQYPKHEEMLSES